MFRRLIRKFALWVLGLIKGFFFKLFLLIASLFSSEILSKELVSALIGAVIGGLFTCFGVYLQIRQQRIIDNEKQRKLEQDKLVYLHYLIQDSCLATEKIANELISPTRGSYFYIGGLVSTPTTNSIEAISSKINQEEYYLAALNQIENNNINDVFRIYDELNTQMQSALKKNNQIKDSYIDDVHSVMYSRDELFTDIKFYINNSDDKKSKAKNRRKIYSTLLSIEQEYDNLLKEGPLREDRLDASAPLYYKLVEVLDQSDTLEEKALLKKARETLDKHHQFINRSSIKYNWLIIDGAHIKTLLDSIRIKSVPLENYVKNLKR